MEETLVFSCAAYGEPRHRDLLAFLDGTQQTTLMDGTKIYTDGNGTIRQAHYSGGSKMVRQPTYCLVQSEDSSYWYGDSNGLWHRLD